MSNDSSSDNQVARASNHVPWNPWLGAGYAIFLFLAAQIIAGLLLSLYPLSKGWSSSEAVSWLNDSLNARLIYLALSAVLILAPLKLFLRWYKTGFRNLWFRRPKLSDALYGLAAFPIYVVILILVVAVAKALVPGLDVDQQQQLGFDGAYNAGQLVMVALALVILPPITEEIIFRGLLFGSLKKGLPVLVAAVITSLIFAVGHLPEGGTDGPLYIAAIDTFVLSMVLVWLREKTGSLWASIGLHAIKNSIAFVTLFVLHAG